MPEAVCCCLQTCNGYILILMMGCMSVQSFIILYSLLVLYHNVWPSAIFFGLHVNNIVYKQIVMLLHDLSTISIFVQSFIPISYLVFEIHLLKLNFLNKSSIIYTDTWFKPFLGCSLWWYGSVWCVKIWIWLKPKVKHENIKCMGIM